MAAMSSRLARLGERWRNPLYRNGYALILSSALTGALGLIYWVAAARTYSAAAVGTSAALIAAMTLLGDLSHLNLKGALNRFLPSAGDGSARFAARSYAIALAVAAAAAFVFVLGIEIWSPELVALHEKPWLAVLFVLGTMGWTIFVLQDSVLTGIRRAVWVPAENLVFAVAKIVALVALAVAMPALGLFVSWTVPMLILIVPVTLLIFRKLMPAHTEATRHRADPACRRTVTRYAAADYTAYLIRAGTIGVLPLMVLEVLGPEHNAYYFLAWTIAYSLYLVSTAMGNAMIAEAALDPSRLRTYARQAMLETATLVVPAAVLVALGAPLLLGAVGADYAEEATTLLRLLALSAIPFLVVTTFVRVWMVQQRMGRVIAAEAAVCAAVLGLSIALIGPLGASGIGVAWLAGQTAVALVIVSLYVTPADVGGAAVRMAAAALGTCRSRRTRPETDRAVARVLRQAADGGTADADWAITTHLRWINDVTVTAVGPPDGDPLAVVKRARTPLQDASVLANTRMLERLRRIPGLEAWAGALLPVSLGTFVASDRACTIETLLPGRSCERAIREGHGRVLSAAAESIAVLHDATAERTRVGERHLTRWIDEHVESLRPVVRRRSGAPSAERALESLGAELRSALEGHAVTVSWVHGDFAPGNVMLAADDGEVSGIVDWEAAHPGDLPQLDLVWLLLTARMLEQRRELGEVVVRWLANPEWHSDEVPVVDRIERHGDVSLRPLVLLAWLRHLSSNVAKCERYGHSTRWVRRNIDPVLAVL